jgi:hypothetical protein
VTVLSPSGVQVRRVPVAEPPPEDLPGYDYADAFELTVDWTDDRPAEQIVRSTLEETPQALQALVRVIWRAVLGFEIGPTGSPDHVVGARVTTSTGDLVHLQVGGPIMQAVIAGRRVRPDRFLFTTFVHYVQPNRAAAVWSVVSPLHRGIARYLLARTGRRMTS